MRKYCANVTSVFPKMPILRTNCVGQCSLALSLLCFAIGLGQESSKIFKFTMYSYCKYKTLRKVLSHLLYGQSFELILNADTGTGKLKAFATKLVRFNEANYQPDAGDPGKPAKVRTLQFNISFLILCRR